MKLLTQGRTVITALLLIVALNLGLAASLLAADQQAPLFGSFHSAKDPDLPPLPFNPHPELAAVEVEKGIYMVDDTGIPDTPEQAAQEASFAAIIEEVSPWLHGPIKMPDGTPAPSLQHLTDAQAIITSSNADAIIAEQQAALDDAITWGATNGWPAVIGPEDAPRGYLVRRDENGPQYLVPFGLAEAITVSTTNVWPGGPTGFGLTGTNVTIGMWDEASHGSPISSSTPALPSWTGTPPTPTTPPPLLEFSPGLGSTSTAAQTSWGRWRKAWRTRPRCRHGTCELTLAR